MPDYPRCHTCKFWNPVTQNLSIIIDGSTTINETYGTCSRWHYGYMDKFPSVLEARDELFLIHGDNEVLVEDDEGWGAYMQPNFGCVLHEPK